MQRRPSSSSSPQRIAKVPMPRRLLFSLRAAKDLTGVSLRFLTASVKLNPNFAPISSVPVWCYNNQVDFQFACSVSLGARVPDDAFSIEICILTGDNHVFASCRVPTISLKQPSLKPLRLFYDHKQFPLKDERGRQSGSVVVSVGLASPGRDEAKREFEPGLKFMDIAITSLVSDLRPEEEEREEWETEAENNGWVSPDDARHIWEQIARKNGWRPPPRKRFSRSPKRVIYEIKPTVDDADMITFSSDGEADEPPPQLVELKREPELDRSVEDFIDFALRLKYSIDSREVFDRKPLMHEMSPKFDVFGIPPQAVNEQDSDRKLNQEISELLCQTRVKALGDDVD